MLDQIRIHSPAGDGFDERGATESNRNRPVVYKIGGVTMVRAARKSKHYTTTVALSCEL